MQFIRISSISDPLFEHFFHIYTSNFPLNERRSLEDHYQIQADEKFFCLAIIENNNNLVGILCYWEFNNCIFCEHLAIRKDIHGKGIGKLALNHLKIRSKQLDLPVILEIEIPKDKDTIRREKFYLREELIRNPHTHCQPPYHKEDLPTPMLIMSWPHKITPTEYDKFHKQQLDIMPILK